ncbi:MAG TPA: M56 family metallopeptidase [Thermoanaerobaculia bacterium]|nr:M56 family metallopeptidase [Thermoanaerobaculia bacterium]
MNDVADFAIAALWQSGLVALAALTMTRALRRADARLRHALLVVALVACAVLPFVPAPVTPVAAATNVVVAATQPTHLADLIALAYLLGVAWSVASLAVAIRKTMQLRASAETHAFDAQDGIPIRTSRAIDVPVTIGVFRPMILLPPQLPDDALRAVLAHEIAHVRRRDALVQLLVEIVTLPVALHPLVRMLKRHVAVAREIACDERAVATAVEPRTYARTLLALAHRASVPRTALAFGHADALELRLVSLREMHIPRRIAGVVIAAIVVLTATLLAPRLRVDLFGPRHAADFNGAWVLDRKASQFGPVGPYDAFTQTLHANGNTVSSQQVRVMGAHTRRVSWTVQTDGVNRPLTIRGGGPIRGTARWEGESLVLDMATANGHQERVRASVTPDARTLVCAGNVRDPKGSGSFRIVFRKKERS